MRRRCAIHLISHRSKGLRWDSGVAATASPQAGKPLGLDKRQFGFRGIFYIDALPCLFCGTRVCGIIVMRRMLFAA